MVLQVKSAASLAADFALEMDMQKKYALLFVLAFLSMAFIPASAFSPQAQPPIDLQPAECPVAVPEGYLLGEDVLCYSLSVPADYDDPGARSIQLAVMVIRASAEDGTRPDPIFFAQGGPGGSTIDLYTSYLFGAHRLDTTRDFVLLEQRGTLYSTPALYCTEYDDFTLEYLDDILSDEEAERLSREVMQDCLDRLSADGINMADFNSFENARDIESLRIALGYDQINLYGVSYGTLLAQHYMRFYPENLRSVILDGVVPPERNLYLDVLRYENRAFRYLFDSCQADPVCSANYPNLEDIFYQAIATLDEAPVSLVLLDLDNNTSHDAVLDGASFYGSSFQMLYNSTLSRLLPRIIYDVNRGDHEILGKVLSLLTFDRTMSYGMYYSVMCAEDGEFDPARIDKSGIRPEILEFNDGAPESILATCDAWNVPLLPEEANQPVRSDVPTLLLSGGFDPVTPVENAELVARNLSRSYSILFPWGAHGQLFDNPCADQIIQGFWDSPVDAPNTACMVDYMSANFYAPQDVIMLPVTFKFLRLDESIVPGTLGLLAGLLGLMSAWFFLPLVWFISLFNKPAVDGPRSAFSLRFATPLALLNGLVLSAFLVIYVVFVFAALDGEHQFLLFFGLHGSARPVFLLPLFALFLTLGMAVLSIQGWMSNAWHLLRKFYYTLLFFSAALVLLILALGGFLFAFFA